MMTMRVMGVLVGAGADTCRRPFSPFRVTTWPISHRGARHTVRRLPGDGPLRRLRVEHGPRTDVPALSGLPAHRHRLDQGLATDLRRRRERARRLGGCRPGALPEAAPAGAHAHR